MTTPDARRDVPYRRGETALLLVDMQRVWVIPGADPAHPERGADDFYYRQLHEVVVPNQVRLMAAARAARVEVVHTIIESLTADGRDRSLDYKITGFHVPKGSWDGKVIDELAPQGDEIWLPKTSSSVFVSTHIDYILRNLGVKQLILSGIVTDQCVESAIRDACDLGYLVTQVTDACATYTQERHDFSLRAIKGYCRQRTTDQVIAELQ